MTRPILDYFQTPVDFLTQDAMLEIEDLFGELAQLMVFRIIALLSSTEGGVVTKAAARACRGRSLSASDASAVVEHCIAKGLLQAVGDTQVTRKEVTTDMDNVQRKRDGYRERQAKSRGSHTPVTRDTNVTEPVTTHRSSEYLNTELLNTEYLNSEELKTEFQILDHGPVDLKALQSAPEVRSARLCFSRNDAAALIMNHYHGDAGRFVEHVREATDHRIKNGLDSLNSERSSAVIRGWIKTAAQIRKGGPAATPKKTNLDRIKEFAQEAQNDTRSGDEDYELDSFGVRREVRAISAPVKSVVRGDGTR